MVASFLRGALEFSPIVSFSVVELLWAPWIKKNLWTKDKEFQSQQVNLKHILQAKVPKCPGNISREVSPYSYQWSGIILYSEVNVFANDVALYKELKSRADCDLSSEDLNSVYFFWSDRWKICLECEALSINKCFPITTTYSVNGESLWWYTFSTLHRTNNLCWSMHCKIIAAKATEIFTAHPLHNSKLWSIYRCIVCPILEYGYQL